ncbi:MAG: adenylate kinase [Lachnospiraceae bacterium]|nr:adenylate kinase [Lachnospiraceae bacterium]
MIFLIAGASHTGKTVLAQKLLETYSYPYLSIDHLKMGLIRSKNTALTPMSSDQELTDYLWPIVREMMKTAIENNQNMIVEGCYIPFDWEQDFDEEYRSKIRYCCLVMSETYIREHYEDILKHASDVETRMDDSDCTVQMLIRDNGEALRMCQQHGVNYVLIDTEYCAERAEIFYQ